MTSRILPVNDANTPKKLKPMLAGVVAQFGKAPNMLLTQAHSPAALHFYLCQVQALSSGDSPRGCANKLRW